MKFTKAVLVASIAAFNTVQSLSVNNIGTQRHPRNSELLEIGTDVEFTPKGPNFTLDEVPPVNLAGKKYKDFDLEEFKIHWNGSREDIFFNTIDKSKRGHLNKSQ